MSGAPTLLAPAASAIWRILEAANAIIPQPRKRPKAPILRVQAAQPNECWQAGMTH